MGPISFSNILTHLSISPSAYIGPRFIESDCLAVVNSVNCGAEDLSDIAHIIQMIKQNISNPCCLGVLHTRRLANVLANGLAKFACEIVDFRVWIEEGPTCISPVILAALNE